MYSKSVRVDGASDKGSNHEEVQIYWTERNIVGRKVAILVMTDSLYRRGRWGLVGKGTVEMLCVNDLMYDAITCDVTLVLYSY